ncbi:tyrosinase family protein [Paracoccus sp. (in: a-proteobacteria)]|uniref:tyrosinase family protein n=1 Tax=Paracoccus sp. TaxID=267 RepID=UPI00321F803A
MTLIRKEIRSMGGPWCDVLLWYARAIRILQARPIASPDSWSFMAAIHGFHPVIWQEFGYIDAATALPAPAVQQQFWLQCQHQSWYFLPWHRGYLHALEDMLRAVILAEGGPQDWALPYWNYSLSTAEARTLPEEFAQPTMPDGSANPLFTARRHGDGTLPIRIDAGSVSLAALSETGFTGGAGDIPPGFGGPATLFHHFGQTNGGLESLPHNNVHGAVGGAAPGTDPNDWRNLGLMSMPQTAGLDPIFWLHHANIDRLWSVWRRMGGHADPTDTDWLDGPSDRAFTLPLSGGRSWSFTARDVLDSRAMPLDYAYDDEAVPVLMPRIARRMNALGSQAISPAGAILVQEAAMSASQGPELIGASDGLVRLRGRGSARVRMDAPAVTRLRGSLTRTTQTRGTATKEPPRVFLRLEGILGSADAAIFALYLDMPEHGDPADYADRLAGSVSLFGARAASDPDGAAAGSGLNQVLEISEIVDALHLAGDDLAALEVRFVPVNAAAKAAEISVRRLDVFRLGD